MSGLKEMICVSDAEIREVRKIYGKTESDIEEDLTILLDWLEKQPHLPKTHDKTQLERFLLRNKFRIERTKVKLDNYYSFKVLYPEFYAHLDFESPEIKSVMKSTIYVAMPKLSADLKRITYWEPVENQADRLNYLYLIRFIFMMWEMQMVQDYSTGDVFVCNMKHINLKYISKIDINILHKAFLLFKEGFSGRVSNIHYVNLPPAFDVFLSMMKRILTEKIVGNIRTHKNLESLHAAVPKEYLPEEVGGTLKPAKVLHDEWIDELILQKDFFKENAGRVSNEALRLKKMVRNELFGIEGTFKKINLD